MTKTITVKVTPKAKKELMEEIAKDVFRIRVSKPAEDGKANARVVEIVAEYFNVSKSCVKIVSGLTYREKVLEVYL